MESSYFNLSNTELMTLSKSVITEKSHLVFGEEFFLEKTPEQKQLGVIFQIDCKLEKAQNAGPRICNEASHPIAHDMPQAWAALCSMCLYSSVTSVDSIRLVVDTLLKNLCVFINKQECEHIFKKGKV